MAAKHEIEIVIKPDGEVKIDIKGIKGPACLPIAKVLADGIGEIKSTNFTGEYYEKTATSQQQKRA